MKLRFGNGFSISLWTEEIEDVEVLDSLVRYRTPTGKLITIRVPASWIGPDYTENLNVSSGSQRRWSQNEKRATEGQRKSVAEENNAKCLSMEVEVGKLKKLVDDLNFSLHSDFKKLEENMSKLDHKQGKHANEISQVCDKVEHIEQACGEIWNDLGEYDRWRTHLEEFLGVRSQQHNSKSGKRGRMKYG